MKGEFFRPCPKCGRLCNSELDMCEICSGKIAKPEPPKPIIPVVAPVVEPIVEEVAPVVEEQVATEEVIGEVTTEENIVEETTDKEKQEEVVAPVIETKAPKGKGAKGLYALVAVLMLVIVALIVVIMQDKQPDITVNNTTLQSNTTNSTTLKQETEITTEITEGTIVDNAGETLAPVTTTKKAQNTSKETTIKKNTSSSTKETTTKKITTTATEASEVEFNPTIVYSKDKVYKKYGPIEENYSYDYKIKSTYYDERIYIVCEVLSLYENDQKVSRFDKLAIKESIYTPIIKGTSYTITGEKYSEIFFENWGGDLYKDDFASGTIITLSAQMFEEDVRNISKIVFEDMF